MTTKTVDQGLQLLELLASTPDPQGVSELGRALGLPKSKVFRLLDTLAGRRYVRRREEDSRYEITLKLWELGNISMSRLSVTDVARPFLDSLAARSGESAQLAVLDCGESVYVDKSDGAHPVSGVTRIGSRLPAHCCATGKAELAFQPPETLKLLSRRLKGFTTATITTSKALAQELAEVRERRYAINRGEWYEDVWGVAAPVRDRTGAVCASIGVWGPRHRLSVRLDEIAHLVVAAASGVSAALGHTPRVP
ncbi:MAG: IclR family transcriptional regulator [Burkholderiaceae bacterium]|nr:IclR family transcriptional regulator [Burkholderiaceae bacterium]